MTCREMETLLRDMALESPTAEPWALPSDAAAHLQDCPGCSAALEGERRLTASLVALARNLDSCEVPAAMEARLLAAFREHSRDCANGRPVFPLFARRPSAWAVGVAAVIVVSLGVALGIVLMGRQPSGAPAGAPMESPVTPTASLANPEAAEPSPSAADAARSVGRSPGHDLPPADAALAGSPAAVAPAGAGQAVLERPPQAGSGFVPLFYGGDPLLLETGQVWRVEMPRGALQSVGMPVVEESRSGRIQVDILLGEDGIARAIRLVQ